DLLDADPQGGIDDSGPRPERRHDLVFGYQTMGISDEKIEYREALGSEDNLFRPVQEGLVRRVEDEGIKQNQCPVAHLPPLESGEWSPPPQVLQKFYDRTIATDGRSVSTIAALIVAALMTLSQVICNKEVLMELRVMKLSILGVLLA